MGKLDRKVIQRKDQLLIAIPAVVRDHLGLVGGGRAWWHWGTKGHATLTATGRLRGGRPRADEECPSCGKYRAELERLRRELREGESAVPGQFWRQGYARALGDVGNVKTDLEVALVLLKELVNRGRRERPPGVAPRARRASRSAAPAVEVVVAPVLTVEEARDQIEAAARRFGPGIGFALPPGVVAVDVPEPD
jgi:hypothetical protein